VTLHKERADFPEILLPHPFPPQSRTEKRSIKEESVTLQPLLSTAAASRSLLVYDVNYSTPKATGNCRGCKSSPGIMRPPWSPSSCPKATCLGTRKG